LQNGVNHIAEQTKHMGKSRDQRKPSGSAMTRPSFPPDETLITNTASDCGSKGQGVAQTMGQLI
jgi:hypothetical protein